MLSSLNNREIQGFRVKTSKTQKIQIKLFRWKQDYNNINNNYIVIVFQK